MMTSRRLAVTSLLFCVVALASRALADGTAESKKQIQKLYNDENAAVMHGNLKVSLTNMAPDFVSIDIKGQRITRAQFEQKIPQLMAIMKDVKAKTTITRFSLKGKEARVNFREHAEATITSPQTQKSARLVIDDTGEDLWVRSGTRWLKKGSRSLTVKQTLDGKPIPGM